MISKSDFLLRQDVVFLNHGSFGACPRILLEAQTHWINRLEEQPVEFFRDLPELMLVVRNQLAEYLGADHQDLVCVTNATFGVNVVASALGSLLKEGDQILATDHEYGACDRAWNHYCVSKGIQYIRAEIPIPVPSQEEIIEIVWSRVTNKTKLIFLSHITSPTAIQLPVEAICKRARAAGILTCIDGSHVPGHLDLNLNELDADFYTANCHKWMCTPKGSAFLWVRSNLQPMVPPLVVSWGKEDYSGQGAFISEHEYSGTRDVSPFLTIPQAIAWMKDNSWSEVLDTARNLLTQTIQRLCALEHIRPMLSETGSTGLLMGAVLLPMSTDVDHMKQWLLTERAIEVVVQRWLGHATLRVSFHAHSSAQDADALVSAVYDYFSAETFASR